MPPADDIQIRPLATGAERKACLALQKETWGAGFTEAVPPSILMVAEKIGGVAAGAFTPDGELAGFVVGLTGVKEGELVHWSDMLAVRAQWQGRGLGVRLKRYQRERVRALGVRRMYWSFDPLEAKNAYINFHRLGVQVEEYVRDMYGSGADNELHRGLGTDRFVVAWDLEREEPTPSEPRSEARWERVPVVTRGAEYAPTPLPEEAPPCVRVGIPEDVQSLKACDPEAAARWREVTREAFEHYLGRGYTVEGFLRDKSSRRCFYLLKR